MSLSLVRTTLASAVIALIGVAGVSEAYAQSLGAAGARADQRRAARAGNAPQQQQQAVEQRYPQATREEPSDRASARIAPQLQRLFANYEAGETGQVMEAADRILADGRANNYEKAMAARVAGIALINEDDVQAMQYLQQVLQLNGLNNNDHYEAMFVLAQLQAQQEGQAQQSLATIDRLLNETRAERADFHALKGNVLYTAGRYAEAAEALKLAVQHAEEPRADVNQLLMAAYAELGQTGQAVTLAEQLAASNPTDVRAQMNLASVYMQADRMSDAVVVLERLRASGQLTEARDYRNLYALYANADGQELKVIEVINDGLQKGILEDNHDNNNALAQAYYFSGQVEPAITAWRKAAPMASNGETYLNLARALINEGRFADARTAAQQALDKGVGNPQAARQIIQNASR